MAPVRRYLRISAHSVVEVRIYLDNPADTHRWLIHPQTPSLPRVIKAIRPLILPKLREENLRMSNKAGGAGATSSSKSKTKGVKDVVTGDDFEVSLFLTDVSSRHSIMVKEKRIQTQKVAEGPADVHSHGEETGNSASIRIENDSDEDVVQLGRFPQATVTSEQDGIEADGTTSVDEGAGLFLSDEDTSGQESTTRPELQPEQPDGEKKMAFRTLYDGFNIYGRILCLVVKRRYDIVPRRDHMEPSGKVMLEDWIIRSQLQ